jgi:thiamine-phosphate pyrophosphorylase
MTSSSIPRFVVILDQEGARSDVAEVASAAIRGGADIVQLREKSLPEARVAEIARRIISAVEDPLRVAINGSPAIAAELGTHLHLPEAMTVRRNELHLAAGAMLSRSIHGPAPAIDAEYAILGNLLETGSKPGKAGIGFEAFESAARDCPAPVLAIGGVEPSVIRSVLDYGGYGVVVRSYVIGADDPERAAREIKQELDIWKR